MIFFRFWEGVGSEGENGKVESKDLFRGVAGRDDSGG
jgi:hypothetical protein